MEVSQGPGESEPPREDAASIELVAKINAFVEARQIEEACPFCRNTTWVVPTPNPTLVPLASHPRAGLRIYTLVCTNCGFVRQMAADVVDGTVDLRPEAAL